MVGQGRVLTGFGQGRRVAGAAIVALTVAGGVVLALAGRSGEAAGTSLTVTLPPAATARIYGSPVARGRPIVVIDAGHGGRDPGARSVSGGAAEKDLTLPPPRHPRREPVKTRAAR